ncbi:putative Tyrosine decarboxylase 1 [Cardiosporidium cionae]|uniref:Tyrosine decarboxylase 1 n=1 Tax=Cardiosporidium cionae TaxID=476202 RepID=A0ABQ7J788_9APIC|nr:putative Tyrosine decarboxylase 1 [Cardiosporidium cionae]|eukprot:KAF8819844.1 putative Tyrosine decarboxylase 1 [Cardiosporidium cionae]
MCIVQCVSTGHKMIDFIVEFYTNLYTGNIPVDAKVPEGYLASCLPHEAPQKPLPFESVLEQVKLHFFPGLVQWQHPQFFGWFPGQTSFASIMGDMLSSTFNVIGFTWAASPVATELEVIMLNWMAKALALPSCFLSEAGFGGGAIQVSASDSIHVALIAARLKCLQCKGMYDITTNVGDSSKLVAYGSDQAHSSFMKSAKCAGLQTHLIKTSPSTYNAMQPEDLIQAIQEDIFKGLIPCFICGTIGTTSTTAVDPIESIASAVQFAFPTESIWFHVDAAYAGNFAVCEEFRYHFQGLEAWDSFNFNPHKAFRVGFDCSLFYVKNKNAIFNALSFTPEYLRNKVKEKSSTIDFKDWQVALGRRFRSLKLFFVLNLLGIEVIQNGLRRLNALALRLQKYLQGDPRFEVVAPVLFGLVCFRLKNKSNELQERLLMAMKEQNFFLTHTKINSDYIIRVSVGNISTTEIHVDALWKALSLKASEFE